MYTVHTPMCYSDEMQQKPVTMRKKVIVCLVLGTLGLLACLCVYVIANSRNSSSVADHHRIARSTPTVTGAVIIEENNNTLESRWKNQALRLRDMCKAQEQYIYFKDAKNYFPVMRCACNACRKHHTCVPTENGSTTAKIVVYDENEYDYNSKEEVVDSGYKEVDIEIHTDCHCVPSSLKQPA